VSGWIDPPKGTTDVGDGFYPTWAAMFSRPFVRLEHRAQDLTFGSVINNL